MAETFFKCVGYLTVFLYAAALDKFMFKQILGINKLPIRIVLFAVSALAVCGIVRFKFGIIWIAFNTVFLAVMSQAVKRRVQKRMERYNTEQEDENESIL
ncbi:MAG: hypothetical protein IKF64_08090 [Eubacterium sp.]|nr:hypothetical protein [Eubacterium sp.]